MRKVTVKMYEQMIPPEPTDVMTQGLRKLRHGTVNMHPLEVLLKDRRATEEEREFNSTAALFGIGFANHLKKERSIIRRTHVAFTGTAGPSQLGMEISTGDIDEVDFQDMFAPPGMVAGFEVDPHEIQERRFFK